MADELRLVLIIIGALVLGALFLHGLWTVRKNSNKVQHRYHPEENGKDETPGEGFDELGIGPVRVVKGAGKGQAEQRSKLVPPRMAKPTSRPIDVKRPAEQTDLFSEPKEPVLNFSALDDSSIPEQNALLPEETDYDYDETVEAEPAQEAGAAPSAPSEVLILYVLVPEQQEIRGHALLSVLTMLGFKYGDMDIFHRHQDSAGTGEVLFSLANMFNPGTFDIERIDELSTRGLSLFMTLPGPGEPLQNFNLMNNAAKKLAEEFGGQVLDGQRSVLTVQTVRHYVERIREFQRQQLIRG
jgi:cell division protein ZipA